MESIMSDERTTMLKAAVAACFKAHEAITVPNVRAKLPEDFFLDFDSGEPLADAEVFKEIQATYAATPKAPMLVAETPDGHKLGNTMAEEDFSGDADGSLAPETAREPEVEAEPAEQVRPVGHETAGHELNPQARLDAARKREQALLGERPILQAAQRNAREALAKAVRAYQEGGPRQTHEDLARDFIRASQLEREARARGELWATKPERRTRHGAAYVDIERGYSHGGDANTFARRHNRTGNRRGAYDKQSLGTINHDPSRGPVPAPVVERPTIPALSK
jgi:hypothetical protein